LDVVDDDQNVKEEQWNGIDTTSCVPAVDSQTTTKPSNSNRDELRNIKEASDLFKSSSFKLQVINIVGT
jgi:hypothetical protein